MRTLSLPAEQPLPGTFVPIPVTVSAGGDLEQDILMAGSGQAVPAWARRQPGPPQPPFFFPATGWARRADLLKRPPSSPALRDDPECAPPEPKPLLWFGIRTLAMHRA